MVSVKKCVFVESLFFFFAGGGGERIFQTFNTSDWKPSFLFISSNSMSVVIHFNMSYFGVLISVLAAHVLALHL